MTRGTQKPPVLVTGATGVIGSVLCKRLARRYTVIGLDRHCRDTGFQCIEFDLGDRASVDDALAEASSRHGRRFAAVVHLAAYFDFTGEDNPLYEKVNVEGTRTLLRALKYYEVERFVYSGTMLVHEPTEPGKTIDESSPVRPKWAYPISKARAEEVIVSERDGIPSVRLHLAGLYDENRVVPTLAHQIARIYERDLKSWLYSGDSRVGQSFVHMDDMIDALVRAVDCRDALPDDTAILVGEPDAVAYQELQNQIGCLIHGEEEWKTLCVPKPIAKAGAWVEEHAEPIIPDSIDRGEKPFIRPFMVDMADDHYALDITRARELLGWEPRHDIRATLPKIVDSLKRDPLKWYRANGVTPPHWLEAAQDATDHPDALRYSHDQRVQHQHEESRWAAFAAAAAGVWLAASPSVIEHGSRLTVASDIVSGLLAAVLALGAMARPLAILRWGVAGLGVWVLFAPLAFHTPSAAVYLNGTLVGALLIGLAIIPPPTPGVSPTAQVSGPDIPSGWRQSPSAWTPRLVIMCLAFVAFLIARYMAAFQLGHIDGLWDPFFDGLPGDELNGSEAVTSSWVSEAFPVSDAGLGAMVYLMEALLAATGGQRRWRTMPWLVALFTFLIVPMGVVSITFIIIQPILIGTWCALCLATAVATLLMIPFALPEMIGTYRFLRRRVKAGRPFMVVFFTGDTDEGGRGFAVPPFRAPRWLLADLREGNVQPVWTLVACIAIGIWLMFTRVTLDHEGAMADYDHLIGSLVITVSVIAFAEAGRWIRWLNVPLGAVLLVTPFIYGADGVSITASIAAGVAIIGLSVPRAA